MGIPVYLLDTLSEEQIAYWWYRWLAMNTLKATQPIGGVRGGGKLPPLSSAGHEFEDGWHPDLAHLEEDE